MQFRIRQELMYGYILLPIIIFVMGWLKLPIGILICLIVLYSWWRIHQTEKTNYIVINGGKKSDWLLLVIICILFVYFSGIGGFVFQNSDHAYRNEIFNLLVNEKWPVIKPISNDAGLESRGMVYYIGFWLPAALIGKIFGLFTGYMFQFIWAVIGLALTFLLLMERYGKFSIKVVVGFIFFSGLDILGCFLLGIDLEQLQPFMHMEWWSGFQFSSFTTQLFWVFNQAIYAWILFFMIMREKTNRHIIIIWSVGLLTCTLPFVGMLPFLIYKICKNAKSNMQISEISTETCEKKKSSKVYGLFAKTELFTIENILGGGCIGIVSFIYEIANISATNNGTSINYSKGYLFLYIIFMLLEVGVYAIPMYKYQYKNVQYWLCILVLMVCPWIRIGSGMDFCMRASIPGLMALYILVVDTWSEAKKKRDYCFLVIIAVVYLVGAMTPLSEFWRTTRNTAQLYYEGQSIMAQPVSEESILGAPNFSGNTSESLFFKYFAKK